MAASSLGAKSILRTNVFLRSLTRHRRHRRCRSRQARPRLLAPTVPLGRLGLVLDNDVSTREAVAQGVRARVRPEVLASLPAAVDGIPLCEELHIGRQAYYRKIIKCPHHAKCYRKRGCSENQTKLLGALEPVAFLGCWAVDGLHMTRAAHRRHRPGVSMLLEYSGRKGWLL